MKKITLILLVLGFCTPSWSAEVPLSSLAERYSYAMCVQIANLIKTQGVTDLNGAAFAAAVDDVLGGKPLRLDQNEIRIAMVEQQKALVAEKEQRAKANLQEGRAFLEANAKRDGVVVLASGLQYEVLASGDTAGESPAATDRVEVHYHGTKANGEVFDSSVERGTPAKFGLNGVIPGFREALMNMREGDHWKVFVPSDMAYGESGAGARIGPNEVLVFELQLLKILR
jgi:FKBP-type peptidyl-prolyl cis-trans isomerase FklB